jgi:signal transduction histidine kinase
MNTSPLILVVDDHEAGRFAKTQLVRRYGYRVVEAGTGAEAVAVVEREGPDLILLDINLPDFSGFEVCRRVRDIPSVPPIQVLQLSSTAVTDADRVTGLTGGADAYLTEPVAPGVLMATIGALLRVRRAEQERAEALDRERASREEAERANRFKDEFLATLSHELRTPLSAMVGWIWQLRQGPVSETVLRRALDALERSTQLQVRLIEDLLDVSRISKGKLELDVSTVELGELIQASVDSLQFAARSRQLVFSVDTEPLSVLGDPSRLQQIVVNLLKNAIQYGAERSVVHVSLRCEGDDAVIRVRDEGQGIEADLLPHIFDLFRQGESGLNRRHGGLGLGLAIARQITELHGGTIGADSAGPGQGSTFTVRIPVHRGSQMLTDGTTADSKSRLDGRRVLVVDDDEQSREWMCALVESSGGRVRAVGDVAQALAALREGMFDLLVSDIGMPGPNGFDLIRVIRESGNRLPAAAVTAFAQPDDQKRILASGYDEYFAKPLNPEDFLARLSGLTRL